MRTTFSDISTTKMTSKGQVVIPEEIREHMQLESGTKFIVMATGDSIIFKKIFPIPQKDFKQLLKASHAIAKKYKLTEKAISESIAESRANKRNCKDTDQKTTKRDK